MTFRNAGRKVFHALVVLLVIYVGSSLAAALVQYAVERMRGYTIYVLKTRMYWKDGKAVAGEKVKTWRIAIPNAIAVRASPASYAWFVPADIYTKGADGESGSNSILILSDVMPDGNIIPGTPIDQAPKNAVSFPLRFSNYIPNSVVSMGKPVYLRDPNATRTCISMDGSVDYHGWVIILEKNRPFSSEQICQIITLNLDKWTTHIDDLYSRDSGK